MILIVLALLCLISVPLAGGSLRRIAHVQVRLPWLAPLAVVVQTMIVTVAPGGNRTLHDVIHIGTYVAIGVFLWVNRRIAGVPLIAAGALLNGLVITINGGVMPASAESERLAGMHLSHSFHNSAILSHPHLLWFGDVIPIPGPLPNVLSLGDCIIYAGMLVLLHRICGRSVEHVRPAQEVSVHSVTSRRSVRGDEVYRARAAAAAQWLASARDSVAYTTRLRSTPIPSTSNSTTSPG